MTEKELKKLNRYQLLEIILMQAEELEKVTAELEQTKAQLEDKQIKATRVGDIAQASLALAGVFEAAQSAADIYVEAVKQYAEKADEIIANAHLEAERIVRDARETVVQQIADEAYHKAEHQKSEEQPTEE